MLTAETRTHPGGRPTNEDCVLWDPALSLMAIADGMGGHNAGEVASRLALDAAREFLRESLTDDVTWAYRRDPELSLTANRLVNAVKLANREILRAAEGHAELSGMGTTLVLGIVEDSRLTFASVGDSRLYALAGSKLRQLTRDDSWVAMLSAETGVDASLLKKHPMNHVLTSVVGARPELEVKVQEVDLEEGETLVMCTDGLHGVLADEVIQRTLEAETDLGQAAERLVQSALENRSRDNVTVLVARYSSRESVVGSR